MSEVQAWNELAQPPPEPARTRFVVRSGPRVRFVRAGEIDWVQAQGDYVGLHVGRDCFLLRATIAAMERRLEPRSFARIHRSSIVNLDSVLELRSVDNGDYQVLLRTGAELRLSRSYRTHVERLVGGRL
jgi:two-component system LytT family response regulator